MNATMTLTDPIDFHPIIGYLSGVWKIMNISFDKFIMRPGILSQTGIPFRHP